MERKQDEASEMRHYPTPSDELILGSVKEDIVDIKADKLNYLHMSRHQHVGQKEKKKDRRVVNKPP